MAKVDGRGLDHRTLEHLRKLAVRRVIEDGEAPSTVITSMGLCRTSIYRWLREFRSGGLEALAEKISKGPAPKLDDEQRAQVRSWILGRDPRQYGFDFGLWTRSIVQTLIQDKFGISLCLASVGRLLAMLDITPQKPLRRAYERDPQAASAWQNEVYPQIKARARRQKAEIFFLDEAGFQSDPPLGRTYGLKGQTPVLSTSGQRQSINAISAVNALGQFWAATYPGKLDAESFVCFLRDFMKSQTGIVFLVVDGHPAHKANLVKSFIQEMNGRLEIHFLPPYAPDLNPDEFVWSYMKNNGVSKRPLKKNESMKERIEEDLRRLHSDPELVRSFFKAASVAYAAH